MRLDLESFTGEFNGYTELRAHRNTNTAIRFINGNLMENSRSDTSGCSARVYKQGAWGFASTPESGSDAIKEAIRNATSNANFLGSKGKRKEEVFAKASPNYSNDHSTKLARATQKQMADFLKEVDAYIVTKYPKLKGRKVMFSGLDMEKTLRTSVGGKIYSYTPRAHITIFLNAERDGKPVDLYESAGGLGNFEDHFMNPSSLYKMIDGIHENLMKKAEGIYASAGTHDVILAPDLAGILAHEAVGHTAEADIVLGGSVAKESYGKVVGSPLVSLTDFAHFAFGETCPVPVYADDEGTSSEDCIVIEKGILKNYMHNKETAARFEHKPLGNARAFQFYDEPLIRMRNTAILPGQSKLEEMIASMDNGYLLSQPMNGQADSTGEFMFAVNMGFEIKGGKLGRAIQNTTVSGVAFEMLKTVSMVSDDMKWSSSGFCGKKQPMSVGMGGPALKCRVNVGGR